MEQMKKCRVCQRDVSVDAFACPGCGAPRPAMEKWDGWGFEYKSEATFLGLPWVHISFKYRPNRMPVPARGVISIGQFGIGIINISQFGFGVFSLSQFTASVFAVAQFAAAYTGIAQFGLFVEGGYGQLVRHIADIMRFF